MALLERRMQRHPLRPFWRQPGLSAKVQDPVSLCFEGEGKKKRKKKEKEMGALLCENEGAELKM